MSSEFKLIETVGANKGEKNDILVNTLL